MNAEENIFIRQKGRQRGNNMLPIIHGGTGTRAERRQAERAKARRMKKARNWDAMIEAYAGRIRTTGRN